MSIYTQTYGQWSGGKAKPGRAIGRVSEVIKHTEAGADMPAEASVDAETRRCVAIDNFHRSLGWGGIGYSSMDMPSGRIYEGRGWFRSGAHTQGKNTTALAICTAGNGDRTPMTEAGIAGVRRWIAEGIAAGALTPDPRISGHRDYAQKSCPGNRIYPQLPRLRGPETTEEEDMPLTDDDIKRIWGHFVETFHVRKPDGSPELHPAARVLSWASQDAFASLDLQRKTQALERLKDIEKKVDAIPGSSGNQDTLREILEGVRAIRSRLESP